MRINGSPVADPALPALPLAFDVDALSERFQEKWKRVSGQHIAFTGCRRIDTTYEPGVRCLATYELTGTGPCGEKTRTFGVLDVLSSGATHRLFPDDPDLPGLPSAADGGAMRERFAALPFDATGLKDIDDCEVTPVRYKPGERCVLRYELRSGEKRVALFGKLVAADGDNLLATLVSLHDAARTIPAMPRVARPLYYWPELDLVLQSEVAGTTHAGRALDTSFPPEARIRWMRSAGSGLAALHRTVWASGRRRTLPDDADELQTYRELFKQLAPHLAPRFDDAIKAISRYARANSEPNAVPSHGALRTDQFLIDRNDGVVLMDLDGFCLATPARDMGNLFAYLDWRTIRKPEDDALIDEARRAFLEGYAEAGPLPDASWLAAFTAGSMLKIAGRRFRSLAFEEWELVPQLLDAAWATLRA
jgi:hypothetical protein